MEWWAAFHADQTRPLPIPKEDALSESNDFPEPLYDSGEEIAGRVLPIRTTPKIGRNDPCPCGSGKKFKKCCLEKTAEA
jgi:uncharacterized protein YecA (UPF0149 family)